MGTVILENTTTQETYRFYLARFANESNENVHFLSPGSYRVVSTQFRAPLTEFKFLGWFQIENDQGDIEFVSNLPLSTLAPFNIIRPNWMIVSSFSSSTSSIPRTRVQLRQS